MFFDNSFLFFWKLKRYTDSTIVGWRTIMDQTHNQSHLLLEAVMMNLLYICCLSEIGQSLRMTVSWRGICMNAAMAVFSSLFWYIFTDLSLHFFYWYIYFDLFSCFFICFNYDKSANWVDPIDLKPEKLMNKRSWNSESQFVTIQFQFLKVFAYIKRNLSFGFESFSIYELKYLFIITWVNHKIIFVVYS